VKAAKRNRLDLAWAALACLTLFVASARIVGDNDVGFHLRLGQDTLERGRPPHADFHSHTAPGAPYPDHEWLAQVILALTDRFLGLAGLVYLQAALVTATAVLLLSLRPPSWTMRLVCVAFFAGLGAHHVQTRPHLFGWLLSAALVWLLDRGRLRWVPPLLALWANLHASVGLGVAIALLHLYRRARADGAVPPFGVMAACVLAPLLNPYHVHVYALFFQIRGAADFVGEWKPFRDEHPQYWMQVALFALGLAAALRCRKPRIPIFLEVVALGWLTFTASRNGVVAAIYLAPILLEGLATWVETRPRLVLTIARAATVGALAAMAAYRLREESVLVPRIDRYRLPVEAVSFLQRHRLPGPVFNDYNFGGYFLWKGPEYPVFVDGRVEVYRGRPLEEYLQTSNARPGWASVLDRHRVRTVVVRPERTLARELLQAAGWKLVYFDYNSVVFTRVPTPGMRALVNVSPYGHRNREAATQALDEITYLVRENPRFFGGHKIQAFLLARMGRDREAARSLSRYQQTAPPGGKETGDAKQLMEVLARRGAWPPG
jgi:hypothetical protein